MTLKKYILITSILLGTIPNINSKNQLISYSIPGESKLKNDFTDKIKKSESTIDLRLWYNEPAKEWMTSALPLGNGTFGAMFFGNVEKEQIQFNEKTLWTGNPTTRGAYQNFGDLFLEFPNHTLYTDYHRELCLNNAIGTVSYKIGDVTYVREYFVSYPDSMLVVHISTPGHTGKIDLSVILNDAHDGVVKVDKNKITMTGKLDVLSYKTQAEIKNEGGTAKSDNNKVSVSGANTVTIFLSGGTNYNISSDNYIGENEAQLHKRISNRFPPVIKSSYTELRNRHIMDYKTFFDRVILDLDAPMPTIPTDELVKLHNESTYLDQLYYQYGRYLMISSSRGMDLPNNLQGIWNNTNTPPWQCDIHTNINIQMNYWPAENTNLSEFHKPFIHYIVTESSKENGSWRKLAKAIHCRGWYVNTQSNIFGHTDWNANRPVNAWYCMHLWQHYAYTDNIDYLRETAFPVMKNTCEFWFDRLTEDASGKLIAPDEWSPEQGEWEDGVSYAQQLIWELFNQTLKATKILGKNNKFTSTLKEKYSQLDNGLAIGDWGQIKEWKVQPDIKGNEHRHLSHLMALYPGNQISYHLNQKYADAAKASLESRGDLGTGWSRAWKIACWARLFDGDHAYKLLKSALKFTDHIPLSMDNDKGGVYKNLLDAHPPFQIDGNFGATAGITEMLIQSNLGFIHVLPALPSAGKKGKAKGLKAEGNFTVNMEWADGSLKECSIYSGSGKPCKLYFPDTSNVQKVVTDKGVSVKYKIIDSNFLSFETKKNGKYEIIIKAPYSY